MTKIIELQQRHTDYKAKVEVNPWPHIRRLNDQIIKQALLIDALKYAAWPEMKFCKLNDNLCISMPQTRVVTEDDYQCLLTIRQKLKCTTTSDAEEEEG